MLTKLIPFRNGVVRTISGTQQHRSAGQFVWKVPGKPVSIHLSSRVVHQMTSDFAKTPQAAGQRSPELGGILLGYIRQSEDGYLIAVENFEAVPCEHSRGESWTLSRRDREHLESRLRRLSRSKPNEPGVVGWYRTHTRTGLYLDQKDFQLFREYFAHPAAIALVVKPEEMPPSAGFFFWEDGDMERRHTYQAFPFVAEAQPEATRVPALVTAGPVIYRPAGTVTSARSTPVGKVPVATAPASVVRVETARFDIQWKRAALLIPVAAGIAFGVFWNPKPLHRDRPATVPDLNAPRETERAVFEPPPPPAPQQMSGVYTPTPEILAPVVPAKKAAVRPRPLRALTIPVKRVRTAEPVLDIQSPPPSIVASARFEGLAPAPRALSRASASIEPVPLSGFRKAVGSIPGLGFLKRKKAASSEDYVPARPVRQVRPLSAAAHGEPTPVRIKVTVSSDGEVDRAELMTRSVQPAVASVALDAAKQWRFEPARLDEKPVSSELILSFRFNDNPQDGS